MANNVTLEIYSEAGDVQVLGDGGIGFGLSATGNLTLVDDGQAHPQPMVVGTVTVNGTNPILAWKGVGAICLERITVSGSTFTFRLRAKSNTNIGLQYWVFDTAASATKDPTMAGIEAAFYDQYGVTTFDATMAAMRIVDAIETPKDAEVIPHGMSSNLGGYTNVTVPSGKVYAVVQSTVGFVFTTYDTGAYSNSSTRPNQIEIGDGGEPGPGMRWRYQRLESYQSTGGYTSANNIRVGMTQFEQWEVGWQPASAAPHINVYGQARHMIVDVTNFTSATAPNPTVVTGGVNATSRSVSTGGASTISQSVTPSVTCSPSGGTAPYSYLWERISGDTTVVANGSATSASFSTSTSNQPQATTRSAVWRCRITDNNGIVGYSPEVTFTHVAQAYSVDVTPDTITNWPSINGVVNENDYSWSTDWYGPHYVNGINQPITLRYEVYDYSGNLDALHMDVFTWPPGAGGWTHHGYFSAHVAGSDGLRKFDVPNVVNGTRVAVNPHAISNSGRKSATCRLVLWSITGVGGQFASANQSFVVDNDNNYNVADVIPNAVGTISPITPSTTAEVAWGAPRNFQITGINQAITLRVTKSHVSQSGNITRKWLYVRTGTDGTNFNEIAILQNDNQTFDFTVTNGMWVQFGIQVLTSAGTANAQWNVSVTNLTGGGTVATMAVNATVDSDNNYNTSGAITPVDWPNMSVFLNSTNGSSSSPNYSNGPTRTIAGLASGQTGSISLSGSADGDAQGWVEIWKNGVNQGIKFLSQENTNAVNTNYAAVSVVNGDTIHFRVGVNGPLATQFNTPVSVYKSLAVTVNASPGGVIDTFNANLSHSDSYSSGGPGGGGPITVE